MSFLNGLHPKSKFLAHLRLAVLASLVWPILCQAQSNVSREFLNQFPELKMQRDATYMALPQALQNPGFEKTIDGKRIIGFRFKTPLWLDGSVNWLAPSQTTKEWKVYDSEATFIAETSSKKLEGMQHSILTSVPHERLRGGASYTAIRELGENESTPQTLSITVDSYRGRFVFGDLKRSFEIPEPLLEPQQVMREMLRIRESEGDQPAITYFEQELEKRAENERLYSDLWGIAWPEAQRRSGRNDPEWGAQIFDRIFTNSWKNRYFAVTVEVAGNTMSLYDESDHHGRVAEILDWWAEAQRLGGYVLSASHYPDLGPAFDFLPEVRRRDIPVLAPFSIAEFNEDGPRTIDEKFFSADGFHHYANYLYRAGQWKESLEWSHWLREVSATRYEQKKWNAGTQWHKAHQSIIHAFSDFEFYEQALDWIDTGRSSRIRAGYKDRDVLLYELFTHQCLLSLKRSTPEIIEKLEKLSDEIKANSELLIDSHKQARWILANALITHGRISEGEVLLDQLAQENYMPARLTRLVQWIESGRKDGVENELIALLSLLRESGNKRSEFEIYRLYADFLEKEGRFEGALSIRREAVRLCRIFNYFTFLPVELAKLAILLDQLGASDAASVADESRMLLNQRRLPPHLAERTTTILAGFPHQKLEKEEGEDERSRVELQPTRSTVIPIENQAWTTHLTLANPSTRGENGVLRATGMHVHFSQDPDSTSILGTIVPESPETHSIPVQIDAGTYRLISIHATENHTPDEGQLEVTWTSQRDDATTHSTITLETAEEGVISSIIQAGEYRNNPFYGIPIIHTYATKQKETHSLPIRFKSSIPTRVEVYDIDRTPLCVDAQGNGSLRDAGDELFGASDRMGSLSIPVRDGEAAFMMLLYPHGSIPATGLLVDVEIHDGTDWHLHAQNRLNP